MGASPSRHDQAESSASSTTSRVGVGGHAAAAPASSARASSGSSDQAQQSKQRAPPPAPPPHKFHEIIAQEKTAAATTAAELEDRAKTTGIYLAGKTKKYWVHDKTRGNCFMLFPRALSITWCDDPRFWSWHLLKVASDAEIELASLQNVCWLEIRGKLDLSHLTPGVTYEAFFEVMLAKDGDGAYGWSVPVNLRLKLPDGTVQERKENLQEKPRGQWLELKVGEIKAGQGHKEGEAEISLFEYDGGLWKKGLLVKGIKIVPKE